MGWGTKNKVINFQQKYQLERKYLEYYNEWKLSMEELNLNIGDMKSSSNEKDSSIVNNVIAKFTLLNVIYFGGALLVIGSMTLFMTLGWEKFGGIGLFFISIMYSFIFQIIGISYWNTEGFQMVGGLFCSMSISMIPLGVYGLLKHFKWWIIEKPNSFQEFRVYIKGSWLPLDIVTIIVGLINVYYIRFPFLLAPVSVGLWFLSMDLTPIITQSPFTWTQRLDVSLWFGLFMILFARFLEITLGNEPDFGFWIYLFGLLSFWGGLSFRNEPFNQNKSFFYIYLNLFLVVIGRYLDRTSFLVFGGIGLILGLTSFFGQIVNFNGSKSKLKDFKVNHSGYFLLIFLVAILLSQSILYDSSFIEFIPAIGAIIILNFVFNLSFLKGNELFWIFHLLVNLGFLFLSRDFNSILQSFSLEIVCVLGAMTFNLGNFTIKLQDYPKSIQCIYWIYRFFISLFICLTPNYLQLESNIIFVGIIGLVIFAIYVPIEIISNGHFGFMARKDVVQQFFFRTLWHIGIGLTIIFFTTYLNSNIGNYIGCLICFWAIMFQSTHHFSFRNCLLSIFLLLSSVYFNSSLLATGAGLSIFYYLSHLAYQVFRDSLLFPFCIAGIGLSTLYSGIQYQNNIEFLHSKFDLLKPIFIETFFSSYHEIEGSTSSIHFIYSMRMFHFNDLLDYQKFINFSFPPLPSSMLTYGLKNLDQDYLILIIFVVTLLLLMTIFFSKYFKSDLSPICSNVKLDMIRFAQNTNNHGLVFFSFLLFFFFSFFFLFLFSFFP